MEKILQWSIASQSGDKEAMEKIGQPDPELLSQLFGAGGPDEPTLMKQSIAVVENPEATLEAKETALDNFEMLVENLDNANNIENLKLWPSIIALLSNSEPSLSVLAASIVGVATQNNPDSQKAFLEKEDGLATLIKLINDESTQKELLLKSFFALSCFVRNYADATGQFAELGGWEALHLSSSQADHKLLLRKLSLISALLSTGLDDTKLEHFKKISFVDNLISTFETENVACIDKSLNIITQLHSLKYSFSDEEISRLANQLDRIDHLKDRLTEDDFHIAKQVAST
ncbi:hypothetical protein FT663_00951 [Candidozyma haemuli var. vulneris]|uniref:Hsp70 nucleotide exchange factor FES1 n=1 Tax=Candidozyma haemuli TaxID=45357 RepID=A0A2V1AQQ9_9ASCO|nr:hypothetical protein CXQ85_001853 [[Candida] haemuloni]KAF3993127.1 hypothetical protein FT662_00755 [[Candida] haemuloni var. vulneris]KAF3994977.1 hypothetical protein FT663_00951 [[Candida] haemuloni var. vulneris]PVH20074.1 hypothetical protein CXQ85_001853 [[Candida] haemuloni]